MKNDQPYGVLFESVKIGPVTTKNRFYQVPHCCGMGHLRPQAHAAMRSIKAQGGWGVVSTEETEIHPTSDLSPYAEQRIWDAKDIPALRLMTDAVHKHGALAAIELTHSGNHSANLYSRLPALSPVDQSIDIIYPKQARRMNKKDILEFRLWHRQAAINAKAAGFDIVYVYAGHGMSLAQQFMLPEINTRSDEYGGGIENRVRLTRELLEDTKEAIGDTCAVAFRFAVDELKGLDGMQFHEEGRAVVELLSETPDLWDVNVSDWSNDSQTSRFEINEGYQVPYIEFVKSLTTKPVVGVGRFTSPDLMTSLIKQQTIDLIGAARPSIADPYLPNKIKEGRVDEIRECIGCNICVSSDNFSVPIRCTQNPTMGEEWRRGWHPEKIKPRKTEQTALVVGAGPAGLECSMQLARRGYHVILSEAAIELGGRVLLESDLKGLSAWKRVVDNRVYEIQQKTNIEIYRESELTLSHINELGVNNVFIATGSSWRDDGVGRSQRKEIAGLETIQVLTPTDAIRKQSSLEGPIVIYDDDQGYLAGVIADHLSSQGHNVTFVTPASIVSPWTVSTLEQQRVQKSLLNQNVNIIPSKTISSANGDTLEMRCIYTNEATELACKTLILVTERLPNRTLYLQLLQEASLDSDTPKRHIELIGDALAPGLIADAVFSGHLAAENFETSKKEIERAMFMREMPKLK
ncbi:MAG: FAD-dependent oxidoreductase [Candidatus Thioglobus sp.]|jgi:dimethylamine/trimethylamine dehydrogenase|nr:FAD-dependent oxidoreductase [Candidatus Thioglobus sp.]|tara:strand:- start:237 stop:2309 length:2073 start_codon:yes stop_codon:yes gene_type:complete